MEVVDFTAWTKIAVDWHDLHLYRGRKILVNYEAVNEVLTVNDKTIELLEKDSNVKKIELLQMPFVMWFEKNVDVEKFPVPSEITDGGYDYVINVSDEYIQACHTVATRVNSRYFWFPMNEKFGDVGLNSLYGALQILHISEQQEARVLLHCKAGANRSQMVADAYYYMRLGIHRKTSMKLKERQQLNVWLGLPKNHNANALQNNCRAGHLPRISKMEEFLKLCAEVFAKDETEKNGMLDTIKHAIKIENKHKKR